MLNGTESEGVFSPVRSRECHKQGAFPESRVRHVYGRPFNRCVFHSKYVGERKVLKGCIKSNAPSLLFFCRLIPISLWLGSLLAVARGGTLCQLGND